AHPLVRRVRILAGQTEAHEEGGRLQHALELGHDRDGPALTGVHDLPTPGALECRSSSLDELALELRAPWAAAVQVLDVNLHSLGRMLLDVRTEQLRDTTRILVGHQAAADLRHRLRWQHRLRALAGVAGEKAIHLARRSHPDPLERGLPGL